MINDVPRFEEVYVISDLHLGGGPGRQIFGLAPRLAAMIQGLATREPNCTRALVINGDFVDFLAEQQAEYFDGTGSIQKLERIVSDAVLKAVFEALREYVKVDRRQLVIVLGNHDVELALAHVQHWLSNWLADSNAACLGRITFATDGSGYLCEVGGKRVLCLHGNEFDDWNVVDHRALLAYERAWNRGSGLPEWAPNGGTRLVIDVMNDAKQKHALVDLLKPETKAAVPMVLAFSPELLAKAGKALRAASVRAYDGLRMATGFLGSEALAEHQRPTESEALADALAVPARGTRLAGNTNGIPAELWEAQARIEQGEPPPTSYDPSAATATLGIREWWDNWSMPKLRAALERWLANDKTFDISEKDDTFRAVDEAVGNGVHFVLAGHTHLRRALPRKWPGCYYFNTGTWIRLIQIDNKYLESDEAFKPVVEALANKNLTQLDAATLDGRSIVKHLPTVGSVTRENGVVVGRLQDVAEDGKLTPLKKAEFR